MNSLRSSSRSRNHKRPYVLEKSMSATCTRGRELGSASAQSFSRFDTEQILIAVRKFLDTANDL